MFSVHELPKGEAPEIHIRTVSPLAEDSGALVPSIPENLLFRRH